MLICLMKHAGLPLCKTKIKENALKCGDLSDASQASAKCALVWPREVFEKGFLGGYPRGE